MVKAGTEPTEVSDLYESRRIDVVDGKLATDKTPPWELGWGVFIKRDPPYKPSEHNNIIPKDWKYSMPGYSDRTIFNIFKPKYKDDEDKDDKNKDDKEDKDDKDNDKKDDEKENNRNNRNGNNRKRNNNDSSNNNDN